MNERPLISFLLVSYNQEAFMRDAVAGALAQTYSPLEIIITDDCSNDQTFEIAQQMVAKYVGPHSVWLNRNRSNLGAGENINRAMELCRGSFVVGSAGDDISLPERTELIWQAWEQSGRQATSVCSSYTMISQDGVDQELGGLRGGPDDTRPLIQLKGDLLEFLSTRQPSAPGCSHAWSPELFRYFGPLRSDLEDSVLSFRSHAIGQILYIRQPLVKYRRHRTNVSFYAGGDDTRSFEHRERRLRWVDEQTVKAYDNILADIEVLHRNGRITPPQRDRLSKEARRIRTMYAVEREMMDRSLAKKLFTLGATVEQGYLRCALRFTPRLLPEPVYRTLYQLRHWVETSRRGVIQRKQQIGRYTSK
jgi:glycosyltransferase involved in cell wall biosynthesis